MSQINIDAQIVNGEPYISMLDLVEWLIIVNEELEEKGMDTTSLQAVIQNLHEQCVTLRKQISDSRKSIITDIKNNVKEAKKEREESNSDL
mgnify:FL=1